MAYDELTIADVLEDPLIRQIMQADRVSTSDMTELLLDAAGRIHAEAGCAEAEYFTALKADAGHCQIPVSDFPEAVEHGLGDAMQAQTTIVMAQR
tara:strand:- start:40576 stop:40860 length:285 start_codon:yes stop_codon:yes gene_type:complete